jgi:outer membrane receptor protein involved in Fe transport
MGGTSQRTVDFQFDVGLWFGIFDDVSNSFYQLEQDYETETFEARLVSTGDGPIEWIAGFWYEKEEGALDDYSELQTPRPDGDVTTFGIPQSNGAVLIDKSIFDDQEELAVYGEMGYRFTDKAKLTLGYRRANL